MNKEKTQANNTRLQILQAANQLVLAEGVARLTLEAVAQKAGVSKGGLLYHFKSKEELIKGLIEHLNNQFDEVVTAQLKLEQQNTAGADKAPGSWLRAYVRATFETNQQTEGWLGSSAALLTAVATNPQLLEPFRQSFTGYQAHAEQDGLDPALATVIRLAADGLWLAALFGLAPPGPELGKQVEQVLFGLSRNSLPE